MQVMDPLLLIVPLMATGKIGPPGALVARRVVVEPKSEIGSAITPSMVGSHVRAPEMRQ